MRKTKIICTLGPSTDKDGVLEELIKEGMNVARFNFSHGLHDEQKGRIDKLKEIRTRLGKPVAALLDTKGPEIRICEFADGKITLKEGQEFTLTADEIAKEADFFCFGTNDLTQMTYGFSRDDAGKFLNAYYDAKIFENDPFAKLDQDGVGKLMKMAIDLGRPVNSSLHVGICGEHGGDPSSVEFCNKLGLDYVSCSPFRVPIARLAAAQAAIAQKNA